MNSGFAELPAGLRSLFPEPIRPFDFTWRVPLGGFRWREGDVLRVNADRSRELDRRPFVCGAPRGDYNEEPEWVLVVAGNPRSLLDTKGFAITGGHAEDGWQNTTPLKSHSALFREFASLDTDDLDQLLGFANRHGMLGLEEPIRLEAETPPHRVMGERYMSWRLAIRGLRRTVRLWDAVARGDTDELSGWVVAHDAINKGLWETIIGENPSLFPGNVRTDTIPGDILGETRVWGVTDPYDDAKGWPDWFHTSLAWMWRVYSRPELAERFMYMGSDRDYSRSTASPLVSVATRVVAGTINQVLDKRVSPFLSPDIVGSRPVMRFYPNSLLAALWFQFAQAVTGNKDYRQCRDCRHWFEVSAEDDARTARRLFCSSACKSRDYRRRKDRAVELRAEGLKPAAVAERLKSEGLETDIETVKQWTKKKGK